MQFKFSIFSINALFFSLNFSSEIYVVFVLFSSLLFLAVFWRKLFRDFLLRLTLVDDCAKKIWQRQKNGKAGKERQRRKRKKSVSQRKDRQKETPMKGDEQSWLSFLRWVRWRVMLPDRRRKYLTKDFWRSSSNYPSKRRQLFRFRFLPERRWISIATFSVSRVKRWLWKLSSLKIWAAFNGQLFLYVSMPRILSMLVFIEWNI